MTARAKEEARVDDDSQFEIELHWHDDRDEWDEDVRWMTETEDEFYRRLFRPTLTVRPSPDFL